MSYMISTSFKSAGVARSARTAIGAMQWILARRADGASAFRIVDDRQRRISETELAARARAEAAEPVWLDC